MLGHKGCWLSGCIRLSAVPFPLFSTTVFEDPHSDTLLSVSLRLLMSSVSVVTFASQKQRQRKQDSMASLCVGFVSQLADWSASWAQNLRAAPGPYQCIPPIAMVSPASPKSPAVCMSAKFIFHIWSSLNSKLSILSIPFKSVLCSSEATHGLIEGLNLARQRTAQPVRPGEVSEHPSCRPFAPAPLYSSIVQSKNQRHYRNADLLWSVDNSRLHCPI